MDERTSKTLVRDGRGKPVDLPMKKPPNLLGDQQKKSERFRYLVEKTSRPMPMRKNRNWVKIKSEKN